MADATYPADAIEAALDAENEYPCWRRLPADLQKSEKDRVARTIAAFDAAMLAHGWKRVKEEPRNIDVSQGVVVLTDSEFDKFVATLENPEPASEAAKRGADMGAAMYDAAPEVKP